MAPSLYYAASWFSQQAVDKGLKALYIEMRATFPPRTHNLNSLAVEVNAPTDVAIDVAVVNPAFDMARYPASNTGPAPVDAVTLVHATSHLDAAERVMQWIDEQLSTAAPSSQ